MNMDIPTSMPNTFTETTLSGLKGRLTRKSIVRTLALAIFIFTGFAPVKAQVVINELGIAPSCASCNAAGGGEFIELFNQGPCPVDLSCNVILWTGVSGGGNPTGWTILIPNGVILAPCSYYVIGGSGTTPGVGWTVLATGGNAWDNPAGPVNQQINASYCTGLQSCRPGNLVDSQGQLNLLDATGAVISSVSYNSGNDPGSFPAQTNGNGFCPALNSIGALPDAANNVNGTWNGTTGSHGIELTSAGTYVATSILTPGAANASQIACATGGLSSNAPTSTNPTCSATCNGSATASVSGGTPAYTYSWSPSGGTAATASSLCAGTYTCTITDAGGCSATQTFTITAPAPLAVTPTQTNLSCNAVCTGSATASVSGGTGSYTYAWTPSGGTAATASGLCQGNYTCTIKDNKGCSKAQTYAITQPAALTAVPTQTNLACNAICTGSATVAPSGGTGSYTYSWTPSGGTAATASSLCQGNYTCTITDNKGCTNAQTFAISQPSALIVTPSQTNLTCNAVCSGSATAATTGGTGAYTYSWSPSGGAAATASSLCQGNYTCTIKDNKGCSTTQTYAITQPAALALTPSNTPSGCSTSTGTASVSVTGGTGSYTYSWTPAGGTGATANNLPSGTYTVTVHDGSNCVQTATTIIGTSTGPSSSVQSSSSPVCNGACTGTAAISVTGGTLPYTYAWSPSGGTASSANGLCANTYTCNVRDANNCLTSQTIVISQPAALSIAPSQLNIACNGGSTGSATATVSGGTGPYAYSWTPSGGTAATASGLSAGTYTCSVKDASNCTTSLKYTITQATALAIAPSQTNIKCNGASTGSATVSASGGTGAGTYTYSWTPSGGTGATASGLTAGTYTCTLTDGNGCPASQVFTLTAPTALAVTPSQTNAACKSGATGTATAVVSGGTGAGTYTYNWTPSGGTAATASGLSAGTYTCSITDQNGCPVSQTFTITEPTALVVTPTKTNVLCNGASTGSATAAMSGGTGAYTYSWTPSGGTGSVASNLAAGTYTCTIQDANACTTTSIYTITQPADLVVNTSTAAAACSSANGSAWAIVTGGTGPYSYSWSPTGGTKDTATGLAAGNYTVTLTDAGGCIKTSTLVLNNIGAPVTAVAAQANVTCNASCTGSATVSATGGKGAYTYSWSPSGGTASSASALCAGSYVCSVRDSNNCITNQTVVITQPPALAIAPTQTNVLCASGASGTATSTVSGGTGTGTYTYSWTPSGGNSATASGLAAGTYTCSVTDGNACPVTHVYTITEPPTLVATSQETDATCAKNNGIAFATVSGGQGAYSYSWSPGGASTDTIQGIAPGVYTCTIKDANGCMKTTTVTVNNVGNPAVAAIVHATPTNFCQGGSVTLVATGGGTYSWSNGSTLDSIVVSSAGNYTVTVTNSCGSATASIPVTIMPQPVAVVTGGGAICAGDSLLLTASGGGTYLWSSGSTTSSIHASTTGTYTVTVSNNCGSSSAVANVLVHTVTAGFNADSILGHGTLHVVFTNTSSPNTVSWNWNFGDGQTATGPGATHVYTSAGTYTAVLTVTDVNGCTSTITKVITVEVLDSYIVVPNIITPNGDGTNDLFIVRSQGITEFDVKIYDRWGVLMTDINSPNEGWDARTVGGQEASNGTYYYILKAKASDKKVFDLKGFFLLIR
jgi:gliding motility-associated-like protein